MTASPWDLEANFAGRLVRFRRGWLVRGQWGARPEDFEPDSGEPPEVVEVIDLDDEGNETDVLASLSEAEVAELERECWEHQEAVDEQGGWL